MLLAEHPVIDTPLDLEPFGQAEHRGTGAEPPARRLAGLGGVHVVAASRALHPGSLATPGVLKVKAARSGHPHTQDFPQLPKSAASRRTKISDLTAMV